MAALDFPNPPLTVGQLYNGTNGVTYQWDGTVWSVPLGGAQLWSVSGSTLTPTDATKTVTVPGDASGNAYIAGTRTAKTRLYVAQTSDSFSLSLNRAAAGAFDDAATGSWRLRVRGTGSGDDFGIFRSPASGSETGLLTVTAAGVTRWNDATGTAVNFTISPGLSTWLWINNVWGTQEDAGKSSWGMNLNATADSFTVVRRAPGGASGGQNLVAVDGFGNVSITGTIGGQGNLTISGATATKASGTTWANPSDERMKRNVADYGTGLAAITQISPVSFEYNGEFGGVDDG